jgi:PAP2 superfamily
MSMPKLISSRTGAPAIAACAVAAVLLAITGASARADTPGAATVAAPATAAMADPVIQWNQALIGILNTPGVQPATIHATRSLAILNAAIYDAVVSIQHKFTPYAVSIRAPRRADATAAAAAAGYAVLSTLYPSQQESLGTDFASMLAQVPNGYHKYEGVRTGEAVAQAVLALRADDGSAAPQPVFTPSSQPGRYQLTPPAFAQPVFTQWPLVRPFVLRTASQFRPVPPPEPGTKAYTTAYEEVRSLGSATSTTRTPDQTEIAQFWNPPIWIAWNQIAENAAIAHHDTLMQDARLFAQLDLALADSAIAFYDAKYTYDFWRPVTAVRATDDPNWTPLVNTAQDPSYPGAHAVISAAGAGVLTAAFGARFSFSATSTALPGVQRSFTSFNAAANEATLSRIYAGQHFRTDENAGQTLGSQIASYVLGKALLPVHHA